MEQAIKCLRNDVIIRNNIKTFANLLLYFIIKKLIELYTKIAISFFALESHYIRTSTCSFYDFWLHGSCSCIRLYSNKKSDRDIGDMQGRHLPK